MDTDNMATSCCLKRSRQYWAIAGEKWGLLFGRDKPSDRLSKPNPLSLAFSLCEKKNCIIVQLNLAKVIYLTPTPSIHLPFQIKRPA